MKKYYSIFLFVFFSCWQLKAQGVKDSSSVYSLSRFKFGLYAMPHVVKSNDPEFPKHTRDNTKILGQGIIYGLQVEYKLSDRRALRLGVLLSEERGNFQLFADAPGIPFEFAIPGYSYFLKTNENYLKFPIQYKYTFIRSSRMIKLKPYLAAGLSYFYIYKKESIYLNNGGIVQTDHSEVDNTFRHYNKVADIVLMIGLNYALSDKLNIHLEPYFSKVGSYATYRSELGITYNYWGLGIGVNYIIN